MRLYASWRVWVLIAIVLGVEGALFVAWWNYEPDSYKVLFMSDSTVGTGDVYVDGRKLGSLRRTGSKFPVAEGTWRVARGMRIATIITESGDTLSRAFKSGESAALIFERVQPAKGAARSPESPVPH